jgi:exosome complex component RRP4
MIYVKEKDLVVPGEILAEDDYYAGRGTFQENGKVCSNLLGLVSLRNKKISVIPLKSKYLPKKGDVVIGKIDDVRFSMWGVDINSPYPGILPASEVFGRDKKDLSRVFDIGDVLFLRIVDVDEVKKVKLGLKGRGMGKFKGGIIVDIAPTKVPRLIGKKGSMINMIKDKTGCKIVVGQNGLVWVKGKQDMEQIVKDTIKLIEKEAHTSGLTDRIKNRLCLLIDGELPEEENEEMEENFDDAFKKPELQDFREEAERELADEKAQNEEDFDDFDEDIDESENDFDEDLEESEDDFEDIDESEDEIEEEDFDESEEDDEEDFDESEEDDEEDFDESEEEIVEDEDESDDEIVEEDEAESEEEIVEDEDESDEEIIEEDEAESEEDIVEDEAESEEEIVEDEAESEDEAVDDESEETVDEESEESESADLEEEEEKPKESKFLDTFKHIKEQEKKNKSSFDLSRRNRKSPTLNISSNK